MFVTLGTQSQSAAREAGPAAMLLECHERIRRLSSLGVRLATIDAPGKEIAEVAERVKRYFTVALPLHAQDEDLSLWPALFATQPSRQLEEALRVTSQQHLEIDTLLAQLIPVWETLTREPSHATAATTLAPAEALVALFTRHLAIEEEVILPAARTLPAEVQTRLVSEFQARRR